jgi:epsilon-lactone hydrolase
MPSLQSYAFRLVTKIVSTRMGMISSIPRLRAFMGAGQNKPRLPQGVGIQSVQADGVPVEWVIPPNVSALPVILYLHGGAWTLGLYNGHRNMVAYICLAASCRALVVDYRLAPENPFPAALEDCVSAYRWLLKNGTSPQQIVIAGDSAGGNLTLTTLMTLRDAGDPLPAAAVCISPMTDLTGQGQSFNTNHDPLLTSRFALTMARLYAGNQDPCLPLISPHFGNLKNLPPLLIHVGEDEILLSDAQQLAENARSAGVNVNLVIWEKMWHVWHTYIPYLPEAQQAVDELGSFIRESLTPDSRKEAR